MLRTLASRLFRSPSAASSTANNLIPKQHVVVVGTGWAGFRVAMDIDKTKYEVTVISPRNHFLFTPLLPSTAVGTLEFRSVQEPVRSIQDIHFYLAKVNMINFEARNVSCIDNAHMNEHCNSSSSSSSSSSTDSKKNNTLTSYEVKYDYLILAPGCDSNTFNVPGVYDNPQVFFLRQLKHARQIRNKIIECFETAMSPSLSKEEKMKLLTFVIVGGGPTNIEFASELYDFIQKDAVHYYPELVPLVNVTIVEAARHILGSFNASIVSYVESMFKERKVNVMVDRSVKEVLDNVAVLSDGTSLPFGVMVWNTGLKANPLTESITSLLKLKNGRLAIDSELRVLDFDKAVAHEGRVFAMGDCAGDAQKPLPQLAQVAMQQAKYLAKSLNTRLNADGSINSNQASVSPFNYFHLGSMLSVGNWNGAFDGSNIGSESMHFSGDAVKGFVAFLLWRSAYWTKQVSIVNKILIPMYWFKSAIFGRDISQF